MKPSFISKVLHSNCCDVKRHTDSKWSWVVCLCGLVSNTVVTGCLGSFAVLFPAILDEFQAGKGLTAMIGSVGMSFTYLCGPMVGKLCEKLGCRCVTIFGSITMTSGFIFSSQVPNVYLLFLSYSVISAFGMCCIYTSAFLIVTKYFKKRRFLATGFIASGPGSGVFIIIPITQSCLTVIGWRYTFLVLSGFSGLVAFLSCTFDPIIESERTLDCCERTSHQSHSINDNGRSPPLWRNPTWFICTLSTAILSFGAPVPQVHMVRYCEELGYSANQASRLYIFFGIASLVLRISTGKILDWTKEFRYAKPQYFYQVSVFIIGITTVVCPHISDFGWLIAYFTVFGMADGCFSTAINVIILNAVSEKQRGLAYGFWLGSFAIPMALGPVAAGFLADAYDSYTPAFYMAGSVCILSSLVIFILVCWKPQDHRQFEEMKLRESQDGDDDVILDRETSL